MCSIPGLPSPGSNVNVIISRVNVSPLCVLVEFWGNFVSDQKLAYQQMRENIQYPRVAFNEGEGKPGDLCLVRVYKTWYRARIVSRTDAHYDVFLIDEGRTLQAQTNVLAWGQTDFFNLSPEVEFCILSNVLPLSTENRWSKLALEFMKSFCGRAVNACVLDFAIPQRTFLLDIPCLSRQMYEMGFAKKLPYEEFKNFVSRILRWDAGSVEPLRITSMGFKPLEPVKTMCYMYPELQAETTETVLVTEVNSPLRVFCQLKVFSQELKKLTDQITLHYERTISSPFARPENLGAPCASKGADGKWYRSVLQQVISTNNVMEVLHVDYGKKQFVQVDHVRPLAPEFFRMPVVTYVCSLHGVVDRGVGWTVSQVNYLKSLLLNRTVIAKFEYQSHSEGVHYVTLYGDENININKLFGSRENCSVDSVCLKGYTLPKIGTCHRCQISCEGETQGTEGLKKILTESLSPNTDYVAVVQHVDSPTKFWIQTQKYAAEFELLMHGLTELYSNHTRATGLIREPVPGRLCVAKAEDGVFYRATVCEVVEMKAEVFFLDYGNKEWVECTSLRELPLRYQNIPALAIKCALYGIQPRSKEWDLNATLFFTKAVVDKALDVHVVAKSQDTHLVQVTDSVSCGEKDVSKLLCSEGLADMENVDKPVVTPYTKLVKTSDVFKTSAVSQSSSSAFKEYLFPIGSSFDVTVSYIESPNDFWCQKASDSKCLKLLMQDLQMYYATSEFQPPLEAACVAYHPENKLWYRALVLQKHQTSNVTVLFVDYGETKTVPIYDLRRIDPEFLQLTGQAFRCCLYNLNCPVSHSSLVWSPDAMLQFREFVDKADSLSIVLKCTVYAVMCDTRKVMFNVVDLESPFQSICKLLVQRDRSEHPCKTESLPPLRLDTYYYSSHGIKTGSEEDVCITYVKKVSHFFCHLSRNSVQIDILADKVNSLCRDLQSIKCPEIFGNVCFAKYTDGLWYRGQVKTINPSVVIHFVDYGDTQQVQKSELLPVPFEAAEIMKIPVQAVECGLSDLPENVPSYVNNWFKTFVANRELKALIVAKEPSRKLIVELYDGKTPVHAIIREKFQIEFERNKQITMDDVKEQCQSYSLSEKRKASQWTPEKHWKSQKNADPEECARKLFDGDIKRNVTPTILKHRAKPTILKLNELPEKVVKPGMEAEVFISHGNSCLSFFVQLVADESDICSLVEKLNEDQSKHVPVNPVDLCEGDLVCAVYPDDDAWYRAVVRKALVDDTADVEFIDFGNTAEVSVSKICVLEKLFFKPRYSIHCSLTGELTVDSDADSNFKTEMEKKADSFFCKFIQQSDSVWKVELRVSGEVLVPAVSKNTNILTVTGVPESQDTDFNLCTYKNPDVLTGQIISVYASVIIGPQLFWCQYAEAEKLQEITDVIQKIGSNLESRDVETLPIGSGCIALFDEDKLWYRAKVTSVGKDTLSVLFVDYGNDSEVKRSDIRSLPFEICDVPPQAFACQLDGFNGLEGSWDDKAADQFFELINDQLLKVTILKLASSSEMVTPHFVKLEHEELSINDAMKKFWTQNSKTSFELANAPSATFMDLRTVTEMSSPCVTGPVVRTEDPLCVDREYLHNSPLQMQSESDGTLAEHVDQAGSPELLHERNVDVGKMFSQDDHNLTSACIEKPENVKKCTNVNTDTLDSQHSLPADVHSECHLDSKDTSNGAFTGSLEHETQLETASPEVPSCDEVCENRSVSEPEENKTESDNQIIKSDLGNIRRAAEDIAVGTECVIWSHIHERWCRAKTVKISDDCILVLLLDHDFVVMVDSVNIFEVVPQESLQAEKKTEFGSKICAAFQDAPDDEELSAGMNLVITEEQTQGKELDPFVGDSVSEAEISTENLQDDPKPCPDLDLSTPQEMSHLFVADVLYEQATKTREQVDELMDIIIPVVPLEMDQEAESEAKADLDNLGVKPQEEAEEAVHNAVECFSFLEPTEFEQPTASVDLITQGTEDQPQDKERDSCLDDLVAEFEKLMQQDVMPGPDSDIENPQEMSKMSITDVSVEQNEPAMDASPALEAAQDLCSAVEVQIKAKMVETELLADDTVSSDLQTPPDAEDPTASTVTHLNFEDTSDDIIFVKQWQVSPTAGEESSSQD